MQGEKLKGIVAFVKNYLLENAPLTTEYQLITELGKNGAFDGLSGSGPLALFQKHFLTRHALYQLRQPLLELGWVLDVQPVNITLHKFEGELQKGKVLSSSSDEYLCQYYLDMDHFYKTTEANVQEMLDSFWEKYLAYQSGDGAFEVLGLKSDASWAEVQQSYRIKVQRHHPDKGGDPLTFQEIQEAYDILKKRLS